MFPIYLIKAVIIRAKTLGISHNAPNYSNDGGIAFNHNPNHNQRNRNIQAVAFI